MHYLTTQVLARPARPQPRARERMRARQPRIVICAFSSSVLGAAPHRMLTHFWRAHAQMRPPGGKAASCVHAAFPPGGRICAAPCRAARVLSCRAFFNPRRWLLRVQASSYLHNTMYFNPPLQSVTCTLAEPECTLDATPGRAGCTRSTLRLAEPGERERSCH